ncbi:PPOX class F420-dependent oxidoreductase [Nocardioides acrostichi]|uniref:PPOX class F420-dependent oxidoreductase n=1 Tax=Nocardioides acrostichi TaxID=2784339 RepID=A0A930UT57_9ACTN|nr:PPOX class F420-dependent oxidoreductase [Nocardioides acrostichi]MBF4160378.1 PPOX class F420-dependent oxidoreductase [Nocardioides acrostichi]
MTTREELAAGRYMAFTTYRHSGEEVTTPVWVVPVSDGRVGFWTADGSGKTKRLAHTAAVNVQPCDARGRLEEASSPLAGTAQVVRSGAHFDEVHAKVRAKYGVMVGVTKMLAKVGPQRRLGYADTVVLVRLDPPDQTPAAE